MGCANSRAKDKQLIIPRNGDPKDRQRRSTVHINMSENIRELMLNSGRRTIVFFGKFGGQDVISDGFLQITLITLLLLGYLPH